MADQDSVELMCARANRAVTNLADMGVGFTRNPDGTIYQRKYGGQSLNFGAGGFAYRSCSVFDKTGSEIMEVLFNKAKNLSVDFFAEVFVLDLILENNQARGLFAFDLKNKQFICYQANNIIIASGGYAGIYKTNTAANLCTGDGVALALKNNILSLIHI